MGEGFVSPSRIGWLAGVAVLVMIVNIVISILYMVVYGYIIDPGHDQAYYDAHIQAAAPYSSIVAGIPLMFLAGYSIGRLWDGRFAIQSALVVWAVYFLIDLMAITAAGFTTKIAVLFAVSFTTKLAAIYAGALIGRRKESIR